eukprot:CAMPEP_0117593678 /NCGR_PEP_ID=MMETSP0784-20121206/72770_1 /TAXON_ID=39447 /ORGANISM="" /LENGTH=707 /DNA_ID=CAMNT_0005395635 /DNA_START=88 /DNA_END=2211 /DNA_ORIENTATION=-
MAAPDVPLVFAVGKIAAPSPSQLQLVRAPSGVLAGHGDFAQSLGAQDSSAAASTAAFVAIAGATTAAAAARARRRNKRVERRTAVIRAAAPAAAIATAGIIGGASAAGAVTGVMDAREDLPARVHKSGRRPVVIVLGSGWGAASFVQGLSEEEALMYEIIVVSPRNHFLYTPLLPFATMGTTEERSIVTPVRQLITGKADYLEAQCDHVDPINKVLTCSRKDKDTDESTTFNLEYDILVYAVGAKTNDFGCAGVREHAYFFKEVNDARRVREKVLDNFEKASLPTASPEQRDVLLSFVVVGGGPTGVEVAADLADFVKGDAKKLYPKLLKHVRIRLVNTGANLLATYDREISRSSLEVFQRSNVEVLSGYRVVEVTPNEVVMNRSEDNETVRASYGCVVWAAGIKENALSKQLKSTLIEMNKGKPAGDVQANNRGIVVDEWMQVCGSNGSIYALGDASTVQQELASNYAEELFKEGGVDGNDELDIYALRDLFERSKVRFPQFEDYANYLQEATNRSSPNDDPRIASVAKVVANAAVREERAWKWAAELVSQRVANRKEPRNPTQIADLFRRVDANKNQKIDFEEFKVLLSAIDENLRAFPATAQVAAQQGKYLAKMFAKGAISGKRREEATAENDPFTYFHKGSLAYLGDGDAAFDLPVVGPVTGPVAGVAWKLYETSAQVSWKNRAMVALDWVRSALFGRDTSRL